MTTQQSDALTLGRPRTEGTLKVVSGFISRKPLGAAGALIIIIMVVMAVVGPLSTDWDPLEWTLADKLEGPSGEHWLGTDDKGRDLWSRMMSGARISLMVGFLSVAFGSGSGGVIGVVSGWYGGKVDNAIQRLMDALMSIPTLILAMAITAALGTNLLNIIIAIGIVQVPRANRVVRSQVLAVKESQYVDAARSIGAVNVRIMGQHIAPQCVAPWLIIATSALGIAILTEASLSFIGLGVPQPEPSWGGMLAGPGRTDFVRNPWMAIWPADSPCLSQSMASTCSETPFATSWTRA